MRAGRDTVSQFERTVDDLDVADRGIAGGGGCLAGRIGDGIGHPAGPAPVERSVEPPLDFENRIDQMEIVKDRCAPQGSKNVETGRNRVGSRQKFRRSRIAAFEGDIAQRQDRVRPETDLRVTDNICPRARPR